MRESQLPASTSYLNSSTDPNEAIVSGEICSTVATTSGLNYLDQPASISVPQQRTNPRSGYSSIIHRQNYISAQITAPSNDQTTIPVTQVLTPPTGDNSGSSILRPCANVPVVEPGHRGLVGSGFVHATSRPMAPLLPTSPDLQLNEAWSSGTGVNQSFSTARGQRSTTDSQSQSQSDRQWAADSLEEEEPEPKDPENVEARLLIEVELDRQVESNMLAFLVHGFAAWSTHFTFDPTPVLPIVANYFCRGLSSGYEARMTMLLLTNAGLAISGSTNYDLTDFMTLYKQLTNRVAETRLRGDTGMTRELALAAMEYSHQFISRLFKVGSLANVLTVMSLYAPVFRCAHPGPSEGLVNLPRCLATMDIQQKYYAGLDVLQSFLTQRPMFFRYDLDFLSPQEEAAIKSGKSPGLRWLYGVPDQLTIVLARMNSLLEDFGSRVGSDTIQQLEQEIEACTPIVSVKPGADPILGVRRIVVQESWRMAAQVYLYMGLCSADSLDPRVIKVQQDFMRILEAIRPRRNPDSFLVFPMAILGTATASPDDRSIILTRLLGVTECSRPETVGNDIVRMLKDVWARTDGRPIAWTDLRTACLRVTGM